MVLQSSRTLFPHAALRHCTIAVLYGFYISFIHMDDMIVKEPAMEATVKGLLITVKWINHWMNLYINDQ